MSEISLQKGSTVCNPTSSLKDVYFPTYSSAQSSRVFFFFFKKTTLCFSPSFLSDLRSGFFWFFHLNKLHIVGFFYIYRKVAGVIDFSLLFPVSSVFNISPSLQDIGQDWEMSIGTLQFFKLQTLFRFHQFFTNVPSLSQELIQCTLNRAHYDFHEISHSPFMLIVPQDSPQMTQRRILLIFESIYFLMFMMVALPLPKGS